MPKKVHDALAREARKKGLKPGTPAYNKFVYGTMTNMAKKRKKRATNRKRTRQ